LERALARGREIGWLTQAVKRNPTLQSVYTDNSDETEAITAFTNTTLTDATHAKMADVTLAVQAALLSPHQSKVPTPPTQIHERSPSPLSPASAASSSPPLTTLATPPSSPEMDGEYINLMPSPTEAVVATSNFDLLLGWGYKATPVPAATAPAAVTSTTQGMKRKAEFDSVDAGGTVSNVGTTKLKKKTKKKKKSNPTSDTFDDAEFDTLFGFASSSAAIPVTAKKSKLSESTTTKAQVPTSNDAKGGGDASAPVGAKKNKKKSKKSQKGGWTSLRPP
jgi:hypothetical protein